MSNRNLAVQFPSITFSVARGSEYVGRNVKYPLLRPILTNKFKILTTIVHKHPFNDFPFVSTNQRDCLC